MELNKIAAAILLAGLIAMITGKVSDVLYYGSVGEEEVGHEVARGYTIAGADAFADGGAGGGAVAEKELASIAPLMATADAVAGEEYFKKKCTTCHNADKGGPNMTGPNLWGVLGRDKGSHGGFNYSKAMAEAPGNWTYDDLNHFINKPKKFVAGTMMAFPGEPKDTHRANLIAFLRSRSDSPLPLPKVEEVPAAADAPPAAEAPAAAAETPAKAEEAPAAPAKAE